jgi:hypothetical protein
MVTTYFGILNAGMKRGNFAALAKVYAPDATLTQSSPKGVTTVVHGLAAITRFYRGRATKFAGFQWTQEQMRNLAPTVVLSYKRCSATASTARSSSSTDAMLTCICIPLCERTGRTSRRTARAVPRSAPPAWCRNGAR